MRALSMISAFVFVSAAMAAETLPQDFDKDIQAPAVGTIHLEYRDVGEPVSQPARLKIFVKCDGRKAKEQVESIGMCNIKEYKYEKETKTLKVQYVASRIAQGSSVMCDQSGEKDLDLGKFCTELFRKKVAAPK